MIVEGTVLSAKVEPHPTLAGLNTVAVTLRVARTLKGAPEPTFTFRQFIWDIRDRFDAAGYRRGESLLLFMNSPSRYGLSSPVGLEQGRFRIIRGSAGALMAVNGAGNAGLLSGVSHRLASASLSPSTSNLLAQHRSGPIALEQLNEIVLQLERIR
jgi:hypothetical protein